MSSVLKTMITPIAFCFLVFFIACSSESNHAGVITETESGKTIAGIVTDIDGNVLPNVEISLLERNHIAARMVPMRKTFSHKNGTFELDSIENGEFAIQMNDGANFMSAYITLSINDSVNDSTINLSTTSLNENASLEIDLSEFSLAIGDTFCLTGTTNYAVVDSAATLKGAIVLSGVPATEYSNAILLQSNKGVQEQQVDWSLKAGRTLYVSRIDSSKIAGNLKLTIPNKALDSLKHLRAPHSLDSIIVPIKLSSNYKNPSLMDDMGAIITLVSLENEGDSIRYLAILPKLDTTIFEFSILENDSVAIAPSIISAMLVSDTNDVIGENNFWGGIQLHNHSLGINFWIEANGDSFTDSNLTLLHSVNSDIGFSITQCEPKSKSVCTALYNRVDSLENDTILIQKMEILDGKRHHYSFIIKDKHVSIAIDGKTIRDTDVKPQTNFFMLPGIELGNFKLENLTIYTLPNSIRHHNDKEWERMRAWQYAFYYIDEHEDSRSR